MIDILRHLVCPDCIRATIPALLLWAGATWAIWRSNR